MKTATQVLTVLAVVGGKVYPADRNVICELSTDPKLVELANGGGPLSVVEFDKPQVGHRYWLLDLSDVGVVCRTGCNVRSLYAIDGE